MENTAAFEPMPMASVATAITENSGRDRRLRMASINSDDMPGTKATGVPLHT